MFRRVSLVKSRLKEMEKQREDYIRRAPWMSLLAPVTQWKAVTAATAVGCEETGVQAHKPSSRVISKTFLYYSEY